MNIVGDFCCFKNLCCGALNSVANFWQALWIIEWLMCREVEFNHWNSFLILK